MCSKCGNVFLAAIILVFSFWQLTFSKWIIVICAALILVKEALVLMNHGCSACTYKTGSKILMEKTDEELHEGPSKEELKETLKKAGKKK